MLIRSLIMTCPAGDEVTCAVLDYKSLARLQIKFVVKIIAEDLRKRQRNGC
jgi:hypothetical protein